MRSLVALTLLFLLSACQTTKVPMQLSAPSGYAPALAKQLTNTSENYQGQLLKDNSLLLVVRKDFRTHRKQIFLKNLASNETQRITFEQSDNHEATYHPQSDLIFYTSEMDELKEDPFNSLTGKLPEVTSTPNKTLNTRPIGEIYSTTLDHSNIKRRTSRPRFDGEISIHPTRNSLIITHLNKKNIYRLYTLDLKNNKRRELTRGESNQRMGHFSPDGKKLAWIEYSKQTPFTKVIIANDRGKKTQTLKLPEAIYLNPSFISEAELLFSSNLDDKNNFELYSLNLEDQCLKRLTYNSSQDLNPSYYASSNSILFSSDRSGQSQVYLMDFKDYKACPRSLLQNKMN